MVPLHSTLSNPVRHAAFWLNRGFLARPNECFQLLTLKFPSDFSWLLQVNAFNKFSTETAESFSDKTWNVYPHCQHECPLNSRVFQQCALKCALIVSYFNTTSLTTKLSRFLYRKLWFSCQCLVNNGNLVLDTWKWICYLSCVEQTAASHQNQTCLWFHWQWRTSVSGQALFYQCSSVRWQQGVTHNLTGYLLTWRMKNFFC